MLVILVILVILVDVILLMRQRSIMAVSGWSERVCPVCPEYLVKAAFKSVSKLEEENVVSRVDDMALTGEV